MLKGIKTSRVSVLATEVPEEARATMRDNKDLVTCLFEEPDGAYREVNDYGHKKEDFVFKLDVPSTTSILGIEAKVWISLG